MDRKLKILLCKVILLTYIMYNYNFLDSGLDCHKYMLKHIQNAKKVIYISSWRVDLSFKLDRKNKLYDILLDKCKQGVKVYVLTSIAPGTDLMLNNDFFKKMKNVNKNFNFKILDFKASNNFQSIFKFLNTFDKILFSNKKCCDRLFHQRYFNCDDKYCLIGCVDMDVDINCSLTRKIRNINDYYHIEYGISFTPDEDFKKYCRDNFYQDGCASIISKHFYGNFFKINTEYKKIISLISNAKKSIFIENQWIDYSTKKTKKLFECLANKIIQKVKLKESFSVVIITNETYPDMCHKNLIKLSITNLISCKIYTYYYKKLLFNSLIYFYKYLKTQLTDSQINNIVKIYFNKPNLLIHTKNFIIDHNKMLYGTANIWERSYTPGKDLELSIYLEGENVRNIEKRIKQQYRKKSNKIKLSEITNNLCTIFLIMVMTIIIVLLINNS